MGNPLFTKPTKAVENVDYPSSVYEWVGPTQWDFLQSPEMTGAWIKEWPREGNDQKIGGGGKKMIKSNQKKEWVIKILQVLNAAQNYQIFKFA